MRSLHAKDPCSAIVVGLATLSFGLFAAASTADAAQLDGRVVTGKRALPIFSVTLYRAVGAKRARPLTLGKATTRADGSFTVSYSPPRGNPVLYAIAARGSARLAAVLRPGFEAGSSTARASSGTPSGGPGGAGFAGGSAARASEGDITINERTTVATAYSMARFLNGNRIGGRSPGPTNATAMAGNLVNTRTGATDAVLTRPPNGRQTATERTFNTLANMVASCVRRASACGALFREATTPSGSRPGNTLQAVRNIARYPWHHTRRLLRLSRRVPGVYGPAMGPKQGISAWFLALRFDGDGKTINGPGNFAIDGDGFLWVGNNYTYSRDPLEPQCGSDLAFKFNPAGRYVKGSPYQGNGLSGVGYGTVLDIHGNAWFANFGFAAPETLPDGRPGCPASMQPPHNSVSKFGPNGEPLSLPSGFTQGNLNWPQGMTNDRDGSIWIANCGNDTLTKYPGGNPDAAINSGAIGIQRPFDVAVDHRGYAFTGGNESDNVAILAPDGTPAPGSPISGHGIHAPMGVVSDSRGNVWVANSGLVSIPCPGFVKNSQSLGGSVTLIERGGVPARRGPFTKGGLKIPWGISVDGDDHVWVSSFGGQTIAELCGTRTGTCPKGRRQTGHAISPRRKGYRFKGLRRVTAVQVDPSGNVWATNNWKIIPIQANPGGYQIVAFVGLAAPLRTPVIGTPRR